MDMSVFKNEFNLRLSNGQLPITYQPHIGFYLPPNLETLVLDNDFGSQWNPPNWKFVDRLLDLLATKHRFTPKLKVITLYHYESKSHLGWDFSEMKTLANACKEYDVDLCLQPTNNVGK